MFSYLGGWFNEAMCRTTSRLIGCTDASSSAALAAQRFIGPLKLLLEAGYDVSERSDSCSFDCGGDTVWRQKGNLIPKFGRPLLGFIGWRPLGENCIFMYRCIGITSYIYSALVPYPEPSEDAEAAAR